MEKNLTPFNFMTQISRTTMIAQINFIYRPTTKNITCQTWLQNTCAFYNAKIYNHKALIFYSTWRRNTVTVQTQYLY